MKLLILGATGRVGRELVRLALQDGNEVVALVRTEEKAEWLREQMQPRHFIEASGSAEAFGGSEAFGSTEGFGSAESVEVVCGSLGLSTVVGDARSREDVTRAMSGVDAVLCSLNTDGGTVLSESMTVILDVMRELRVKRILSVGTAGILQARSEPHLLRYRSSETRRTSTAAAEDHERAYRLLASSKPELAWTLVCPTYLPDGPATGTYRVERDVLPEGGMRITTGDTAEFTYHLLQSTDFLRCRVGIAE